MGKMVTLTCEYCNQQFERDLGHYKWNNVKLEKKIYCGKDCQNQAQRGKTLPSTKIRLECEFCGKEVWRTPGMIKNHTYCSNKCSHDATAKPVTLTCSQCGKDFTTPENRVRQNEQRGHTTAFCSKECMLSAKRNKATLNCEQCGKEFTKSQADIRKSKHHFCSKSCGTTYNNLHGIFAKRGYNRSKLEKWIAEQLLILFPDLPFKFNSREEINSELDIYIPELKLAFELNGIFHYEPVYGVEHLGKVQNNDKRKFAACGEVGIGLCSIDTSSQKRFTEQSSQPFLDIICKIIQERLDHESEQAPGEP